MCFQHFLAKAFHFQKFLKSKPKFRRNVKIIECVILIIRLVFGRIQALKHRINYQFKAWLSAYKDVLSNIF